MTDETEQPRHDRATVAGVDAKLDGLKELVRAEFANTQRQLDAVAALPIAVAALRTELAALDKREVDADADMGRRVTDLEASGRQWANWRVMAVVSFASALLGGSASHLHIP